MNNIPPQDLRVFIHAARRASFAAAAASELGASPAYMQSRGEPQTIADLSRHSCLLIRERNETFGRWSLEGHGARTRLCIRHLRASLRSGPFALAAPK